MRYTLAALMLCALCPAALHAQWEMGAEGMGMMQPRSFMDADPLWSPDGKWIAFSRVPQQAGQGVQMGVIPSDTPTPNPQLINNLRPLAWQPDSSGVIAGLGGPGSPGGQAAQFSGFWRVDLADPKQITLIMLASNPKFAAYSPDGGKLLLVDERAANLHEIHVITGRQQPRMLYVVRDGEKFLQAGWTNTSDGVWLVAETPAREPLKPGAQLPEGALRRQMTGGMMGEGGMMGPEMGGMMMGEGGMMMGPEMGGMMMGGMVGQPKKMLFVLNLADRTKHTISDSVEAAAWSPTEPLVAMLRKVQKRPTGMPTAPGGMMMGPEMGGMMMGPEGMMGGMGMGMGMVTDEYLALRAPDEDEDAERRVPDPSNPIKVPVWSGDGKMLSGADPAQRRVFALSPPTGPIIEAAQNFDDSVKNPAAVAWSPDATKVAYPGVINVTEGEGDEKQEFIIRGLFVVDLGGTQYVRLTENKTRAMRPGMGGMMGEPGMMQPW